MSNSKKILYGIEDYIADKSKAQQTAVAGNTQTVQPALASAQQTGAVQPVKTEQKIETPSETEPPTPKQPAPTTTALPDTGGNIIQAKTEVNRPMTMIESAKLQMDQARQKVYDILNKKFVYNEKSSPLYSILQRQYEREADRAAGQAYARSVANTGGFGSSYATLAADEARRRTMEGFEDQQYALYQAAKDEFLSERQSAVEWYNMSKQLYADVSAEELDAAYDAGIAKWLENNDEASVRAYLTEQGYSENSINRAITMMKEYTVKNNTLDASLESQANTKAYNDAINTASSLASQGKTEEEIRAALIAGGTPAGIVDQIMSERLEQQYSDAANQAGLKEIEAAAKTEAEAKEATDAYNSWLSQWLANPDETAIRAAMQEAGVSDAAINSAIMGFMEYSTIKAEFDSAMTEIEKQIKDTEATNSGQLTTEKENELANAALGAYDGTNKEQIKTMLKQQGMSDEKIDEVIADLKEQDQAILDDAAKGVSDISSAVAYKTELDEYRANGSLSVEEYDQRIAENSEKIMNEIKPNLDDMSEIDYEALGIPKSEWDAMEESDQKLAVFDAVGEMVKQGVITHSDYERMLTDDTREMFDSEEYKNSKTPIRDAVDRAVVIQDLYESGYLLKDEYIRLIYNEIAPEFEETNGFKYLLFAWDNYAKKDDESFGDFFKYATGNGISSGVNASMAEDFANLSDDQKEVVYEMVKWIYGQPARAEANAKAIESIRNKIVTTAEPAHKASNEKGKDRVGNQNVNFKV